MIINYIIKNSKVKKLLKCDARTKFIVLKLKPKFFMFVYDFSTVHYLNSWLAVLHINCHRFDITLKQTDQLRSANILGNFVMDSKRIHPNFAVLQYAWPTAHIAPILTLILNYNSYYVSFIINYIDMIQLWLNHPCLLYHQANPYNFLKTHLVKRCKVLFNFKFHCWFFNKL